MFKHALIQEAAYQSLLKSTRQQHHQRIAQVLEAQFPETAATQPEVLAQHFTEAGLPESAVGYWYRAGERAVARSAHVEAVAHLTKGVAVVQALPETLERAQHELALLLTLGMPLIAAKGFSAAEVEHAYTRARHLCQQVGTPAQLFQALAGLRAMHSVRGELRTARDLGEQLLDLAQRQHETLFLMEAYRALAMPLFFLGEFTHCQAYLEQGWALYDPQQHHILSRYGGTDPGVTCLCYAAPTLWVLGYPDQALQQGQEALRLAQWFSDAHSVASALFWLALVLHFRQERHALLDRVEAVITLSTEQRFQGWRAFGLFLQGWAFAIHGQPEAGIAQMWRAIMDLRAAETRTPEAWFLALLAEVYGHCGQVDTGLRVLAESQTIAHKTAERFYEAERYRIEGELLLTQSPQTASQAAACFQQARALLEALRG